MSAIKGPEEVYNRFIEEYGYDGDGDPSAIALFAYALVEKDKYEWMAHHRTENNGSEPTATGVEQWFLSKPQAYFIEKSRIAVNWYTAFARNLLKEDIEQVKLETIRDYVGTKLRFWPQLWSSLVCNFIFIVIVGALAAYMLMDFSPIAWVAARVKEAHPHS